MYGDVDKPLTVIRGKKHKYLAMIFDYSVVGEVSIDMRHDVKDIIEDFPVKLKQSDTTMTPTSDNLFSKDNSKKLDKTHAEQFHPYCESSFPEQMCKTRHPTNGCTPIYLCPRS